MKADASDAEIEAQITRAYENCETTEELERCVDEYGVRWLIEHYRSAMVNWNLCLDEVIELREEVRELRR